MGATAYSNEILITNTDFSPGYKEDWIFGANVFGGGGTVYNGFLQAADGAFTYEEILSPTGSGFTMSSWDDEESDVIELYIFNEFLAGGPLSSDPATKPSRFVEGDVIKFKGSARATRSGADTSDMIVRAFIKTLGYGRYAYDTMTAYTAFHNIGSTLQPFDLTVVYPGDTASEPFQVIQLGFEITTRYDGAAMDSGTIYFENIEGYIEGGEAPTWAGYPVDENGFADTGAWMGMVHVAADPWIYVYDLASYVYIPTDSATESGAWTYVLGQ
jgi:hypothetical protein